MVSSSHSLALFVCVIDDGVNAAVLNPEVEAEANPHVKSCFDVFRSDARLESLVHIASSTTRWTAIPLLPLPKANTRRLHVRTHAHGHGHALRHAHGSSSSSSDGDDPTSPISPTTSFVSTLASTLQEEEQLGAASAQRQFELDIMFGATSSSSGSRARPTLGSDDDEAEVEFEDPDKDKILTHKHVCPRCHKRFNRPSSLLAHGRTHTGYKRESTCQHTVHVSLYAASIGTKC
jgi:hypothetical protein